MFYKYYYVTYDYKKDETGKTKIGMSFCRYFWRFNILDFLSKAFEENKDYKFIRVSFIYRITKKQYDTVAKYNNEEL